jgi:hypothetical protein
MKGEAMPADFVSGTFTIPPGNNVVGFSFSWSPGQHPNKGPVFCMWSPGHPAKPEDVTLTINGYAQGRGKSGPVYYSGSISNSCSQPVSARLMAVYFPEFQTDWEM